MQQLGSRKDNRRGEHGLSNMDRLCREKRGGPPDHEDCPEEPAPAIRRVARRNGDLVHKSDDSTSSSEFVLEEILISLGASFVGISQYR